MIETPAPNALLVGYARCSTEDQDVATQIERLKRKVVAEDRIYIDRGKSGKNMKRPGLDQAIAAVRDGDTFIVTELDRLSRSMADLLAIAERMRGRGVKLQYGETVHDPDDPMGNMIFHMRGAYAQLERQMVSSRTKRALAQPHVRAKMKGKKPSLTPAQDKEIRVLHDRDPGHYSVMKLHRMFGRSRQTIYWSLARTESKENATQPECRDFSVKAVFGQSIEKVGHLYVQLPGYRPKGVSGDTHRSPLVVPHLLVRELKCVRELVLGDAPLHAEKSKALSDVSVNHRSAARTFFCHTEMCP